MQDARLVVKYDGKLDNLLRELSWWHETETKSTKKASKQEYRWENTGSPMWFYTYADFILTVEPFQKYNLLNYHFTYSKGEGLNKPNNQLGYPTFHMAIPELQQRIQYAAQGYPTFHPFRPNPETRWQFIPKAQWQAWKWTECLEVSTPAQSKTTEVEQFIWSDTIIQQNSYSISLSPEERANWNPTELPAQPKIHEYYRLKNGDLTESGTRSNTVNSVTKIFRPEESKSILIHSIGQGNKVAPNKFYLNHFQPGKALGYDCFPLLDTTIIYNWPHQWKIETTSLDMILDGAANWNKIDDRKPDTLMHAWHPRARYGVLSGYGPPGTQPRILYDPILEKKWEDWVIGYKQNPHDSHQIWVGEIPMEEYITQQLGHTPEVLLFELYQYGAVIFGLEPDSGKYHYFKTVMLE